MEIDIQNIIKKYLDKGENIDTIQEAFFKTINKYNKHHTRTKKTKKNNKKICRPVLLISDSSCDEFENK
jgi:hypothetical protein